MTTEEKKRLTERYFETKETLDSLLSDFAERVVAEIQKYNFDLLPDSMFRWVWSCVRDVDIDEDNVTITTANCQYGEYDTDDFIQVPLGVFIKDNVEEFVKGRYEHDFKKDEERKRKERIDRIKSTGKEFIDSIRNVISDKLK